MSIFRDLPRDWQVIACENRTTGERRDIKRRAVIIGPMALHPAFVEWDDDGRPIWDWEVWDVTHRASGMVMARGWGLEESLSVARRLLEVSPEHEWPHVGWAETGCLARPEYAEWAARIRAALERLYAEAWQ